MFLVFVCERDDKGLLCIALFCLFFNIFVGSYSSASLSISCTISLLILAHIAFVKHLLGGCRNRDPCFRAFRGRINVASAPAQQYMESHDRYCEHVKGPTSGRALAESRLHALSDKVAAKLPGQGNRIYDAADNGILLGQHKRQMRLFCSPIKMRFA